MKPLTRRQRAAVRQLIEQAAVAAARATARELIDAGLLARTAEAQATAAAFCGTHAAATSSRIH